MFGVKVKHPELRGKALLVFDNVDGKRLKQIGYTKFQYTLPKIARKDDAIKFIFTDVSKRMNELTIHVLADVDATKVNSIEMSKLLRAEKACQKDANYYKNIMDSSRNHGRSTVAAANFCQLLLLTIALQNLVASFVVFVIGRAALDTP